MRYAFLSAALFSTTLFHTAPLRGADDLFSQVAMESVFEKSPASETAPTVARPAENAAISRVTGVSSLMRILKAADLTCQKVGDRVELELPSSGWVFPLSLRVDLASERILCDLSLAEIDEPSAIDGNSLMKLMSAGDPAKSAFFAYDVAGKRVHLRASLSNRNVTATGIRRDLGRFGQFADRYADLWSKLGKKARSSGSQPSTKKPPTPGSKSQPTSRPGFSLIGNWSASLNSSEAFAVRFDQGNRFTLVHLKAGKSTKSVGKAIRSQGELVLQGDDGIKLRCSLKWQSDRAFALAIKDSSGKASLTLNFKKR